MKADTEEWRSVVGWPNYQVSSLGAVRRVLACVLRQTPDTKGYFRISLYRNGKRISAKVHTLVCEAFHGPAPSPKHEVAHGDGVRTNNRSDNLRWDTRAGNHADKLLHGTHNRGERQGLSKLTNEQAQAIIWFYDKGAHMRSLAALHGVSYGTIRKLVRGESWQWLERPPKRDHRRRV